MGIFDKIFGKKPATSTLKQRPTVTVPAAPAPSAMEVMEDAETLDVVDTDRAMDPEMVKVFDEAGRELFITKEQWLDGVLLGILEKHREDPEELYGLLIRALQDGFAAEVVQYAEQLYEIDPIPARGAALLGIAYLANGRIDEAEGVFEGFVEDEGAEGIILSNLARVYSSHVELGRLEEARTLLHQLDAMNRPEWKPLLGQWEGELLKAEPVRPEGGAPASENEITVLSIEGPLWMRHGSPFAALLPGKSYDAPRFTVIGSTVVGKDDGRGLKLRDAAGRLSRSIPMLLAEIIHLGSDATAAALIPWAQGQGFALFGRPYNDDALCRISGSGAEAPDFVIGVTVDVTSSDWQIVTRLVRGADGERLAETAVPLSGKNPGESVRQMCLELSRVLADHAGVRMTTAPSWYQLPDGNHAADYLLRLEQQLTVSCQGLDYLQGEVLQGEREMLDGVLRLCLDQPKNPTVRMLCAQTLRLMKKARPEVVSAYREKAARLRDAPMDMEIDFLLRAAVKDAFAV